MRIKQLIASLISTDKIVIETSKEEVESHSIVIKARPIKREQNRCGICHRKSPLYDKGRETRRWRCLDVGTTKTYIEATLPRVRCKAHGVTAAAVPWARHTSRFCKNFEDIVAYLASQSSKKMVSELMRIEWHTVGKLCTRVYKELEKDSPNRFDGLVNIGIDETSYKKGHKYLTVVLNHDTGAVVWCAIGIGKQVLSRFFEALTEEQRASIRCISADGAKWIAASIRKYCPKAARCVDPFHVVAWATKTLDKERRDAWKEASKLVKAAPKRKRGRPSKGEVVNPEQKQAKAIKNLRYVLLKNPNKLSEAQHAQLTFLTHANPRLYRAYLLKEGLRLALKNDEENIGPALKTWMSWAQRCRIPSFRALREQIKKNFADIVASSKYKLSNARLEAINNKIKLCIRRAFGFRNTDSLMSMVMLTCSDIQLNLPGRLKRTHSY